MNRILNHIAPSSLGATEPPTPPPPKSAASDPDRWLTTAEAVQIIRVSPRTLERWHVMGDGPRYHKAGGGLRARVLYRESELLAWLEGFGFASTSEYRPPR